MMGGMGLLLLLLFFVVVVVVFWGAGGTCHCRMVCWLFVKYIG